MRTFAAATAVAALSLTLASTPSDAQAATSKTTSFGMFASAFGSRVTGGDIPVNSGDLAYETTGCTRQTGKTKTNNAAGVTLTGLGKVGAVTSHTWTAKSGKTVASNSTQNVASIVLSQSALGKLSIKGIHSQSRAYHNGSGFHATATVNVATLAFTDPLGIEHDLKLPGVGKTLSIGSLATITVGGQTKAVTKHHAIATAVGLTIKVPSTSTTISVGHSRAAIYDRAKSAVFGGYADAADASVLGGAVSLGQTPLTKMPCLGTGGKLATKSVAALPTTNPLSGVVSVSGLTSGERASQNAKKASGYTFARVANVTLGDDQIVIKGLRGQANGSWRKGKGYQVSTKGTTFASITAAGKSITAAQLRTILNKVDISGLAKIQTNVVLKRSKTTIEVAALRLTLLDATDQTKTVVNLGRARFAVHHAG
ncbi:MAG: choice-of-anchor P family protein [Nocardioides sp.]|uniref:choice-of-anchor P family protein n=1 Tax=Nocardioides sp. TaxID=35761 RepID=UPI0039E3187D